MNPPFDFSPIDYWTPELQDLPEPLGFEDAKRAHIAALEEFAMGLWPYPLAPGVRRTLLVVPLAYLLRPATCAGPAHAFTNTGAPTPPSRPCGRGDKKCGAPATSRIADRWYIS